MFTKFFTSIKTSIQKVLYGMPKPQKQFFLEEVHKEPKILKIVRLETQVCTSEQRQVQKKTTESVIATRKAEILYVVEIEEAV